MRWMDKIVGVFGGETVQSTYESMIENLQKEAAAMLLEIQNIVPKLAKHLMPAQKSEMDTTLHVLSWILGGKLAVPTVAEMTGTTARALGSGENWKDATNNALRGVKGLIEWVNESVWIVIQSIPDLAIFCYKFVTQESTRDATAKFMVGVGGFITENAWKWETWEKATTIIGSVISKEMKRIGGLPQWEQAEAIGKIPGLIIGALVGGWIVLKWVAKFWKWMEKLGTTIQKAEWVSKIKKFGWKAVEKTWSLAVGIGETGDLVLGAKRLKKKKTQEGEWTGSRGVSEALNHRISEMSARLLAVWSKEGALNPDIAKMLLQMRKDLIAAENAGNLPEVEALLKRADTYFDTHNRLMFPDQRLIHDPHVREVQSRIFAIMTSYSVHRPLSELWPRGREIGDEADRLYREFQRALASKNPEQFDQIIKKCDRFQQNPDKYMDTKTIWEIDEVVDVIADNQRVHNPDMADWSKDVSEKLVQLKEFIVGSGSLPLTKLKQFLDDLGASLKNNVNIPSSVSMKITEKIAQIRQRFFPVDGLFVKWQTINYRFSDWSIWKVRLERWNEQTGLWDVSWKDTNGVIRIQKDVSMENYVPSREIKNIKKAPALLARELTFSEFHVGMEINVPFANSAELWRATVIGHDIAHEQIIVEFIDKFGRVQSREYSAWALNTYNAYLREITTLSKSQKALYNELWPMGLVSVMEQGSVGNCYFIAALQTMKSKPGWLSSLMDIITKTQDGYVIQFIGDQKSTIVTLDDIKKLRRAWKEMKSWQLGDRILEYAYLRKRSANAAGKAVPESANWNTVLPKENGELAHEWWRVKDVFLDLFWKKLESIHFRSVANSSKLFDALEQKGGYGLSSMHPKVIDMIDLRNIFPDKSRWELKELQKKIKTGRWDSHKYSVQDIYWNTRTVYMQHAYTIEWFSRTHDWVEVVNPHDVLGDRIRMSSSELMKKFRSMDVWNIRNTPIQQSA